MMTNKDYISFAQCAKDSRGEATVVGSPRGRQLDCASLDLFLGKLCDVLKADNPRFDREKFLAACL